MLIYFYSVEDHNNPVIGKPNEIQAVSILMGMSGFIVIVVFIWTIVLIALSFRSIVAAPLGRVRLLYFGIPTLVVILSMIFGIFSSGIGLFRNSVSNSFFCTCYNVYIYVIAFATIPISVGDGVAGSSGSQSVSSSGNDAVSSEKSGLLGLNETKK